MSVLGDTIHYDLAPEDDCPIWLKQKVSRVSAEMATEIETVEDFANIIDFDCIGKSLVKIAYYLGPDFSDFKSHSPYSIEQLSIWNKSDAEVPFYARVALVESVLEIAAKKMHTQC